MTLDASRSLFLRCFSILLDPRFLACMCSSFLCLLSFSCGQTGCASFGRDDMCNCHIRDCVNHCMCASLVNMPEPLSPSYTDNHISAVAKMCRCLFMMREERPLSIPRFEGHLEFTQQSFAIWSTAALKPHQLHIAIIATLRSFMPTPGQTWQPLSSRCHCAHVHNRARSVPLLSRRRLSPLEQQSRST